MSTTMCSQWYQLNGSRVTRVLQRDSGVMLSNSAAAHLELSMFPGNPFVESFDVIHGSLEKLTSRIAGYHHVIHMVADESNSCVFHSQIIRKSSN